MFTVCGHSSRAPSVPGRPSRAEGQRGRSPLLAGTCPAPSGETGQPGRVPGTALERFGRARLSARRGGAGETAPKPDLLQPQSQVGAGSPRAEGPVRAWGWGWTSAPTGGEAGSARGSGRAPGWGSSSQGTRVPERKVQVAVETRPPALTSRLPQREAVPTPEVWGGRHPASPFSSEQWVCLVFLPQSSREAWMSRRPCGCRDEGGGHQERAPHLPTAQREVARPREGQC